MSKGKILLVKTSSLGDVVHALPAVTDALAQGYEFDWVVEETFADIPRMHPGVDRVIPMAWRRWRKDLKQSRSQMTAFRAELRSREYDWVLDAQGLIKSAIVTSLARGARAGFSHTSAREPWAAFSYQNRIRVPKGGHAIDRQRRLFAAALNYELSDHWRSGIEVEPVASRKVFLLHGTTWQTKYWPEVMWLDLVAKLLARGEEPLVTWGNEEERARAERFVLAGATMIDRRPLGELIDVLKGCARVVSVDSGLGHLAAAMGIPTVGIYGATSAELTGFRGAQSTNLQGTTSCSPCVRKACTKYKGEPLVWADTEINPPCYASLSPDLVLASEV